MFLARLHTHWVRNLWEVNLSFQSKFNLFVGRNGSGKTSLLEAIYFLSRGKSFRTHLGQMMITHHQSSLSCYGEVLDAHGHKIPIGIEKHRLGEMKCKINGENCDKLSVYAATLPVQLMTPEKFKVLLAGPEERRRFVDWGVFHVEPFFAERCHRYQRLLKQRNAALKQRVSLQDIIPWDKELAMVGEQISAFRESYLREVDAFIFSAKTELLPGIEIRLAYHPGWTCSTLEEAFKNTFGIDQKRGYTSVGPHRAELSITQESFPVQQVLSRGQQKLLICALHLAQAQYLARKGKKCVFLIDDLASELDEENRWRLLSLLAKQDHQVFLTGVDLKGWETFGQAFAAEMFHVEQGRFLTIA